MDTKEEVADEEIYKLLSPCVREWFKKKFKTFTLPQKFAIPLIHKARNTLVTAPTGSGKCVTADTILYVIWKGGPRLMAGLELLKLLEREGKLIAELNGDEQLWKIDDLRTFSLDNDLKINPTPCYVFVQDYEGEILELRTEGGRRVEVTPDHPLLVETAEGWRWEAAKNLKSGSRIAVASKIGFEGKRVCLDVKRAVEELKREVRTVITYRDFLNLRKKSKNFSRLDRLDFGELDRLRVACQLSYRDVAEHLKIGIATACNLFRGRSKAKLRDLYSLLERNASSINFPKNGLVIQLRNIVTRFTYPEKIDERVVRWLAFVLAEGHISLTRNGGYILITQKLNKRLLSEFKKLTFELFGLRLRRKSQLDYVISSTAFTKFVVKYFGLKPGRSRNRDLPTWLLSIDEGLQAKFMNRFFSLDAEIRRKQIGLIQSSKEKIHSLAFLLLLQGIFPCLSKVRKYATNTKAKRKRTYYKITIYGIRNLRTFLDRIGLELKSKNLTQLKTYVKSGRSTGQHIDKFHFDFKHLTKIGRILGLSRSHKNDAFKAELGNFYEVVRRGGFITRSSLGSLLSYLKNRNPGNGWLCEFIQRYSSIQSSHLTFLKVTSIKRKSYKGKLLDLSVPGLANFVGGWGGIILHNTLACFTSILDHLLKLSKKGRLRNQAYCIYISPLRALANDVHRNLIEPLQEIGEIAKRRGIELQEIRVGIRTGDTPAHEKQKMLRVCPHILITTPESMAIMLNSPKFVQKLKDVKWVVVDEVHALADNKRGVHLSLSLERLRHLIGRDFVRVGLSATIHPLDEVAKFLVGYEKGKVRDCYVVDASFIKEKEIKLVSPVRNIIATPGGGLTRAMYKKLTELIKQHRTTLVFTNTRSGTERVVFHLKQTLPKKQIGIEEEEIAAHHGSLSRLVRWDVEERLKRGELRAIISSTSLELGIDIGYIDLVAQLGSPKSVTRCTQRIGRAGHALTAVIKGRILCMDLDDLVECAVMVREVYAHHLDRVQIPEKCLDVLAQHLLGMAITKKWSLDEALEVIRGSYCYRELTKEELANVLNFLSGGYVTLEDYKVYGKCWFDPSDEMFGRRGKYARVIYMLNIGTIPDEVMMRTYTTDGRYIGQLEEEFVERLTKGDRFVLGGRVYEFSSAYGIKVRVKPAFDSKPTVPRWFSEQLPLSFDLALEIGKFREWMFSCLERGVGKKEIVRYLKEVCYADDYSASSIYNYFKVEHDYLKKLGLSEFPSHRNILIEEFIDEWGRKIMVYHTLYGRRVNDAFSRACAYLASKRIRRNVGLAVHDNGFALILPGEYEVEPLSQLNPQNLESVLKEAIARTELLRRRFRHCANRGLMILRNYKGYEIKVSKQQISASTLLKVCEGLEDFPILNETYREILEDTMDVGNAKRVLADLEQGKVRLTKLKVDVPSPFAHGIVLVGMSDVVLMEDRQLVLQRLYNQVLRKLRGR